VISGIPVLFTCAVTGRRTKKINDMRIFLLMLSKNSLLKCVYRYNDKYTKNKKGSKN
jgi:hypothetical protein